MVRCEQLVHLEQGEMNVKNYTALGSLFRFFFFSLHDVLRTCQHMGMPLCRGGGYHMRMRTGQLPTKMDDAQDPHSPTLHTLH